MASNTRPTHLTATNVELLKSSYEDFKKINKMNKMTLAKLLNRAMYMYTNNPEFRKDINDFNTLMIFEKNF